MQGNGVSVCTDLSSQHVTPFHDAALQMEQQASQHATCLMQEYAWEVPL
jgi:hypothetical protein